MENATIHGMAPNWCPICTTTTQKLVEYMASTCPTRSDTNYGLVYAESDVMGLNVHRVKHIQNPR